MDLKRQMKWIEPLARAGYAARGLIYVVLGGIILLGTVQASAESGTTGAIRTLIQQPFGRILVWVLVVGLIGYVAWRLVQALFDTDHHGTGPKGLAIRGGLLASAFTYGTLALFSFSLLGWSSASGSGGGSGGGGLTNTLIGYLGADWVSLLFGIVFAGVSVSHFIKVVQQKYADHMQADRDEMKLIHPVSITGLSARGVVFAIIAYLAFYRFFTASGGATKPTFEDVVNFVQGLPYGAILMTLMGVGLVAFAFYSFIESRYRRINWEDA